jgi:hypothetical protein
MTPSDSFVSLNSEQGRTILEPTSRHLALLSVIIAYFRLFGVSGRTYWLNGLSLTAAIGMCTSGQFWPRGGRESNRRGAGINLWKVGNPMISGFVVSDPVLGPFVETLTSWFSPCEVPVGRRTEIRYASYQPLRGSGSHGGREGAETRRGEFLVVSACPRMRTPPSYAIRTFRKYREGKAPSEARIFAGPSTDEASPSQQAVFQGLLTRRPDLTSPFSRRRSGRGSRPVKGLWSRRRLICRVPS